MILPLNLSAGWKLKRNLRSYLEVVTDKKDAQRWFMIRPPVTLEDLEKSKFKLKQEGNIDDAYKASLEIQQLKKCQKQ